MMNNKIIDTILDKYFTETSYYNINNNDFEEIKSYNFLYNMDTFIKIISKGEIDKLRDQLETNKKYVSIVDKDGETILFYSIFVGNYEMSHLILNYGGNPNHRDNDGQTAIYRAIFTNNDKIISLLSDYNANLNNKDKDGNTPLHVAVLSKNYIIINALLENGAIPVLENKEKMIPSDYAITTSDNGDIVDDRILSLISKFMNL